MVNIILILIATVFMVAVIVETRLNFWSVLSVILAALVIAANSALILRCLA